MADVGLICVDIIDGGTETAATGPCPTTVEVNLTEADKEDIANRVITSLSPDIKVILGLVQSNFQFTTQIYDADGNLVSGKINIYSSTADLVSDATPLKSFSVSASYANSKLIDYKVIED